MVSQMLSIARKDNSYIELWSNFCNHSSLQPNSFKKEKIEILITPIHKVTLWLLEDVYISSLEVPLEIAMTTKNGT